MPRVPSPRAQEWRGSSPMRVVFGPEPKPWEALPDAQVVAP
jgi:hypothetical protein